MFRIARYSGLVAALLLFAIGAGVVWLWDRGVAPAFGQVVDNVKKATALSFTVKAGWDSMPKMEYKFYMQGRLMRMEIPGMQEDFDTKTPFLTVAVFDLDAKKIVRIDFASKTFSSSENLRVNEALAKQFSSPVEWFSTVTDKDAERIGEEQLNGRKTFVYRLLRINMGDKDRALEEGETAKAWVDAESNLPAKLALDVFEPLSDHKTKNSLTVENFVWNKRLEPALFKLAAPEGFKVVDLKPSTPTDGK